MGISRGNSHNNGRAAHSRHFVETRGVRAWFYAGGVDPNQRINRARSIDTYSAVHKTERAGWEPIVRAGDAMCAIDVCLHESRRIIPGEPWVLAHNEHDRTRYLGPAHADCNTAEGKRAAAERRGESARRQWSTTRNW
jgi:hypothetical protein